MADNAEKPGGSGKPDKPKIPPARIGLWVIAGGIGLYLLVTGLVGVLTQAG